jgi:hypothetical protein
LTALEAVKGMAAWAALSPGSEDMEVFSRVVREYIEELRKRAGR